MNSKGFTLIELMVYIAMTAIVGIIATMIFGDTLMFNKKVGDKFEAMATMDEVFMYLVEDVSRTGTKVVYNTVAYTNQLNVYNNLASSPPDSSSYVIDTSGSHDSIVFKTALVDTNWKSQGLEEIKYFVSLLNDTLKRKVTSKDTNSTITGTSTEILATGVSVFNIEEGLDSTDILFNPTNFNDTEIRDINTSGTYLTETNVNTIDTGVVLSGFNNTNDNIIIFEDNGSDLSPSSISRGYKYRFSCTLRFNDSFVQYFNSSVDTIHFMVRSGTNSSLPGTKPQSIEPINANSDERHTFDFVSSTTTNTDYYPQFRIKFSTNINAENVTMYIKEPRLELISSGNFKWGNYGIPVKQNVKAIKLTVQVDVGNSKRNYYRIIPILNNGL